ncbi:hypothetical protein BVX97_05950 [bacterium E08(2017)]|nr:hypothetical protein BVX97_05950 [bacterium E08(2017)]
MTNRVKILLQMLIIGMLFALFHFQGNTTDQHIFDRSTFNWMITRWGDYKGHFSHGYFIPIISLIIVLRNRKNIAQAEKKTDNRALIIVSAALLLQLVSTRAYLPRLSIISFIVLTWSIPWYLYGPHVARIILFPCAYLLFCIPWTFLDTLTFPLRLLSTKMAASFINGLRIEAIPRGTAIIIAGKEDFVLDVADPCSGLNYMLVLMALGALYAYISKVGLVRKWLIFLFAAPNAIIANVARISAVAIASITVSPEFAEGLYHDYSGYIVFIVAVGLLIAFRSLLSINIKEKLKAWKSAQQNHTSS